MTIRTYQTLEDNNYVFTFALDPATISSNDQALIQKYGEPVVDFGGVFNNDSTINYTLPSNFQNLPSSFPVKVVFSSDTAPWSGDASANLAYYRTSMISTITGIITALRANNDTFTNEYVANI